MGSAEDLFLLENKSDKQIVNVDAHQIGTTQIDPILQQKPQRGLCERIDVLGRESAVTHHKRLAVSDELDGARRIIIEPHPPRLLQIEFASAATTIRRNLHKIAHQSSDAAQIGVNLLD